MKVAIPEVYNGRRIEIESRRKGELTAIYYARRRLSSFWVRGGDGGSREVQLSKGQLIKLHQWIGKQIK